MRIRKSFEQAICILLLIGTSEGPLKSHELSKKLDVSDSYLKKPSESYSHVYYRQIDSLIVSLYRLRPAPTGYYFV